MSEIGGKSQGACACMGMGPMLTGAARQLGPSAAVTAHFRAAHLEVLKGLRAMLDEHIAAQSAGPSPSHGTKIHVE